MTITKIEKQKRNKDRWNVFIDGIFACGINSDTFLKYQLKTGDNIDENMLREIRNFDEYLFSKKIAFDFLSYRIRSEKEIKDKLKGKDISQSSIERTIEHLKELKLINDEEFARQLITEKLSGKPVGKSVLRQKLVQKGISFAQSDEILKEFFSEDDEKEFVKTNFDKYFRRVEGLEKQQKRKKMFDYLARKGFDFEIIKQVINENIK
jgi:regulatory protein